MKEIIAIDLFCGAGGLTKGLTDAGIKVVAGFDINEHAKQTYEFNNKIPCYLESITNVTTKDIKQIFNSHNGHNLIAGCAPCQPYSMINTRKKQNDSRRTLLDEFSRVINGVKPHFVLMENVSRLNQDNPYFANFINMLRKNNYKYEYKVLNARNFGVAQNRKRLFLVASRLKRSILSFDNIQEAPSVFLKDIIKDLEPIASDRPSQKDYLHRARKLNTLNLRRIQATPRNGGLRSSWSEDLKLDCHKGKEVFLDNYGRLSWDNLSSTITTKFNEYYSGRFGHPDQDRALSLREGALLQSFPSEYHFFGSDKQIAMQIGNAVPVKLASAVGKIIAL